MTLPTQTDIFSIQDDDRFGEQALQVFRYQAANCLVYQDFIRGLRINPGNIHRVEAIPFLPVEFFKSHQVVSSLQEAEAVFTSSGTTGMITSRH